MAIAARGGASGIHSVMRTLKNFDTDGSKSLDPDELAVRVNAYKA